MTQRTLEGRAGTRSSGRFGEAADPLLPGERREVGGDPARPRLGTGQRRGPVEAGQQALVQQGRVALEEGGEVVRGPFADVVPDQLDPGPADARVVLLRCSGVPGGALDPGADQVD